MDNWSQHLYFFIIPMILANVSHMILVKKDWLASLCIPLASKALGANKTWRGFIVLPALSAVFVWLFSFWRGPFLDTHGYDLLAGFGFGLVYLLAELPNSWVKRSLGIANGTHSKKYKGLQVFIDKSDSLVGMLIFYYALGQININDILLLFFIALGISLSISYILYSFKLKKSI